MLQKSYSLFSEASHPNRSIVGRRSLGIDNEFTLGAGAKLPDALVFSHCAQLMSLWHLFAPVMLIHYVDVIVAADPEFAASSRMLVRRAEKVVEALLQLSS